MANFCLRPANEGDSSKILDLITRANLDTSNLEWSRFVIVETGDGFFAACGQIKTHQDGSHELASIAVDERYRGQGIGQTIVNSLISKGERPLFLICRLSLSMYYQKFGFNRVRWNQVSPFYKKIRWIFILDRVVSFIARRSHLIIMRLD